MSFKKSLLIMLFLLLAQPLFAKDIGWLNVFTDINGTQIYVDGKMIAQDQLVGYELEAGEHYLKVDLDGKKIYAEKFTILANRTNTIVSDHFVDFRTNTPSRGAIDREAFRLRQVKGYTGFGVLFGSPVSGLSFKWWIWDRFGIQAISFLENSSPVTNESYGARILINFADKVAFSNNLNAYLALGYGTHYSMNKPTERDQRAEIRSLSFGLEGKIGEVANALFLNRVFTFGGEKGKESFAEFLLKLATLGLLNTTYVSLELGLDWTGGKYLDDGSSISQSGTRVGFGMHYFF
jgi:hypothetical protein